MWCSVLHLQGETRSNVVVEMFGVFYKSAAVGCSVLQCAAVCFSVLRRVVVCCSVLQRVAVCCGHLEVSQEARGDVVVEMCGLVAVCIMAFCSGLQWVAV